ncbi:hypothetical protein L6164_007143 [Bauhinia variegata]|uniref:Uncharacterized protein n=1 Tax=Bauhinia variegata TaxID=167791 RepID=A0ACB9PYF6_BAUVA|nr:hypothetical protein L6164_007143 [Bauhinia variegata]
MENHAQSLFSLLLLLLFTISREVGAQAPFRVYDDCSLSKLFVFGDSYVDTGNFQNSPSFKPPYGTTFPGKPAGRFSDGYVLTDYIASFLKIQSPIPYNMRDTVGKSNLTYGMNFARGGSGIFKTLVDGPNMTTQIDFFQNLIQQNVYTKQDLQSSLALVNAAGNDYATFLLRNGSTKDLPFFMKSLIDQLSLDLKRIQSFGVGKIAVGLLEPMGCLPQATVFTSYKNCMDAINLVSYSHSQMLLQAVKNLNQEIGKQVFITLDLYNAFLSKIAEMQKARAAKPTLMNPLEPCCVGVSKDDFCGSVDEKGAKKYNVCEKPEESFFWDNFHPSQNGWHQVYNAIQTSLQQLSQGKF